MAPMLRTTATRDARLSELFLLSLVSDGATTRDLRARLLSELQNRDRARELRFGIAFTESLLEWLMRQSARGMISMAITPTEPENAEIRLTELGKSVVSREAANLRRELGFLPTEAEA